MIAVTSILPSAVYPDFACVAAPEAVCTAADTAEGVAVPSCRPLTALVKVDMAVKLDGGFGVPTPARIGSTSDWYRVMVVRSRFASSSSRAWVRSFAKPYVMPAIEATATTAMSAIQKPRRRMSGIFTGTYAGLGPAATGFLLQDFVLPLMAMRPLLLQETGHDDSGL